MVKIRLPTEQDMIDLAKNMRQCDIDELCAVTDLPPLMAVKVSVQNAHPEHIFAALDDDKLLCIGGCSITGNPWLLATDELNKHTKLLTIVARREVLTMFEKWPVLSNVVDARNTQAIRWLKALGFRFRDDYLEIKPGYPALQFEMRVDHA